MPRQDFANEKHLVTTPRDGFADELLSGPIGVHLGGVDHPRPQIQAKTQGSDLVRPTSRIFTYAQGALAKDGGHLTGRKRYPAHVGCGHVR